MTSLRRGETVFLLIAVGMGALFLIGRLVAPGGERWRKWGEEISLKEEKLLRAEAILRSHGPVRSLDVAAVRDQGISSDEMPVILKEIERLSKKFGVVIKELQPHATRTGKNGAGLSFALTVHGAWRPLLGFVASLEESPFMLTIQKAAANPADAGGEALVARLLVVAMDGSY